MAYGKHTSEDVVPSRHTRIRCAPGLGLVVGELEAAAVMAGRPWQVEALARGITAQPWLELADMER
jgi:hypothetical protein